MDEYFKEDHKDEGAKDWSMILGDLQDDMKIAWRKTIRFQEFLSRKHRTFSTYLGTQNVTTSLPKDVQSSRHGVSWQQVGTM
jgi:hypothetical protein